jgi:predicted nucleic acid-binding protein
MKPVAAERFLDTNILLYGYDLDAPAKRAAAQALIEQVWTQPRNTAISVQVPQEFYINFVRRGHRPEEAASVVDDFLHLPIIDNSMALSRLGMTLQTRWQLSLWDAMIVAAAQTRVPVNFSPRTSTTVRITVESLR